MNKQIEHRGYKINISVILNTRISEDLVTIIWHTITVKALKFDYDKTCDEIYYKDYEVMDKYLVLEIAEVVRLARKHIDIEIDGIEPPDTRLLLLGFK